MFSDEKAIVKYCNKEDSELLPFFFRLKRNWRRKDEKVEDTLICGKHEKMIVPSMLFQQCELYSHYTPSAVGAYQFLRKRCRIKWIDKRAVVCFQQAILHCRWFKLL